MGHEAGIWDVEVAPNGEWIAPSADDGTVRLWRMPDEEPPFHTLPLAALLTRLRALTNYRVVEDPTSPSGYRIDVAPISGWSQKPPGW